MLASIKTNHKKVLKKKKKHENDFAHILKKPTPQNTITHIHIIIPPSRLLESTSVAIILKGRVQDKERGAEQNGTGEGGKGREKGRRERRRHVN